MSRWEGEVCELVEDRGRHRPHGAQPESLLDLITFMSSPKRPGDFCSRVAWHPSVFLSSVFKVELLTPDGQKRQSLCSPGGVALEVAADLPDAPQNSPVNFANRLLKKFSRHGGPTLSVTSL
jgi:hypothetical protein